MRLLVLGGTVFLGRHLVEEALARGHELTLFNRGQTNPELFPEAERLQGDRDGDLSALGGRRWDAVVDTSGYVPRSVRASAELLAGAVDHYTFISSISVYADFGRPPVEGAPVAELDDPANEDVQSDYGALKALCEGAVASALPGRSLVIRPGLIVGPEDPTGRFTYWPLRVARGGDVLAPGDPERQVQLIDARDLAAWILDLAERGASGTYNATGPAERLTMGGLLEACRSVAGTDARFVWAEEEFLVARGVEPWMELPLWLAGEEWAGMLAVQIGTALETGLTFRPLAETVRDTLEWARGNPRDYEAGLAPEREAELHKALRGR